MAADSDWIILDTSALLLLFTNEPGAQTVAAHRDRLAIPFISLTEFMYLIWRRHGEDEAVARYTLVTEWKRPILWPDERILLIASRFKDQYNLRLADSYIVAFAKIYESPLLTKNRDYQRLQKEVSLISLF